VKITSAHLPRLNKYAANIHLRHDEVKSEHFDQCSVGRDTVADQSDFMESLQESMQVYGLSEHVADSSVPS